MTIERAAAMNVLLSIAEDIVADSTSPEAEGFDTEAWLQDWINRPQPALGNRAPSEFISTSEGLSMVARLLGALRSGAYQ